MIMATPALKIEKVVKRYGKQEVLSDVSLQLEEGEYLGLVGVNGAGKTTLIKCLLDFVAVTKGNIEIFGLPHTETNARRRLSFLPEKFMPPYYLTGQDFLEYMLRLHNVPYAEKQVMAILEILDLDPSALRKPVRQFSKGMSQKLGLAACLLSGKELLILDEPMSGLDPMARARLKRYLIGLKEKGTSLFFSTHLLADVEALCDRIIILHGGKVFFAGTPAECCRHYEAGDLEQAYLRCVEAA